MVLYVGWTFDRIPAVWLLWRVTRSAGQTASQASGLYAAQAGANNDMRELKEEAREAQTFPRHAAAGWGRSNEQCMVVDVTLHRALR